MDSQQQVTTSPQDSQGSANGVIRSRPRRVIIACVVVLVLYYCGLGLATIHNESNISRALSDERDYYLPTIRHFAHNYPSVDLSDYPSAMTPAYHLTLAVLMRWVNDSVTFLRLAGSLYGAILVAVLVAMLTRRFSLKLAVMITLPLSLSLYVISSSAWLLPDNAGWLGMLLMLIVALRHGVNWTTYVWGGLILLVLVMTRQIHLWTAAPLVVATWLGHGHSLIALEGDDTWSARCKRLGWILLAILPAIGALCGLMLLWHGLTPPSFQGMYNGRNPAVPATVLSLIGGFGIFYVGFLIDAWRQNRPAMRWVIGGAIIGLLAGILPVTTFSLEAGRNSGLWNLVPRLPVFMDRSLLIAFMSLLGGMLAGAWLAVIPQRDRTILLTTLVGFTIATATNPFAWQRYIEPFVLIFILMVVLRSRPMVPAGGVPDDQWLRSRMLAWGPVLLLAILQFGITLLLTVLGHGSGH